jgi:hypothetical protein
MIDDSLDLDVARALRAYAEEGIRRIDPGLVAETAIREGSRRRFRSWLSRPAPAPSELDSPFDVDFEEVIVPLGPPALPASTGLRFATGRLGSMAIVLAAVVAGIAIGVSLPEATDPGGVPVSPPSTASVTPPPSPADTPSDAIRPWRHDIQAPAGIVHLSVPPGWRQADGGAAIFSGDGAYPNTPNAPSLAVHDVSSVVADVCPSGPSAPVFVPVGPTAEDLTTALESVAGLEWVSPADVMLGGYPAETLVLSLPSGFERSCGGPEGRLIWKNATGHEPFGLLNGGLATVYVVDVHGVRLVITTHYRGASDEEIRELDDIVRSIDIDSSGVWPAGGVVTGRRHPLIVDGVALSFEVPEAAWGWEQFGRISLNKSVRGPQGAEGIVYWAAFPDGAIAHPCPSLLDPAVGPSAAHLAAAVATAPGTGLVAGPSDVEVGGRPASHVVLTVREAIGCDPGFFYAWDDIEFAALWTKASVGDTIRVWIVEVDGTRLFIAGISAQDAGAALEQEIELIVESIRFG